MSAEGAEATDVCVCGSGVDNSHPSDHAPISALHYFQGEIAMPDGCPLQAEGAEATGAEATGGEGVRLSEADITAVTKDDMRYWLGNPFMDADALVGKVCWWTSTVVAARVQQAEAERDALRDRVEALAKVPQVILNTVDPLDTGADVRMQCVTILRAALKES